jgi:hypothetical protein
MVVTAQYPDGEFDLVKVIRSAQTFLIVHLDRPDEHYTFRDGERPHYTAIRGLRYTTSAGPIPLRTQSGVEKHRRVGWPSRWEEIDTYQLAGGSGYLYREDVRGYPEAKARKGVDRLAIDLLPDEGAQIGHYLVRAGDSGSAFVASMAAGSDRTMIWVCARWDPWSVVVAQSSNP